MLRAWRFQPSSSNSGCQSRQHTKTGRGLSLTTSLDANGNTFARKKNIPLLLCVHTEIICNSMAQYKAEERNSCFYRCVCVCVHTCSVYMCFIVLNTLSVCHLLYIMVLIKNKSHFICLKYGTDTFCSLVMHVCCFKFNNMWKQEDDLSLLDSESQRSICLYLEKKNDSGFRSSVELFSSHLHFAITSYWHKKRKWPPRQSQSVIQMIIFFKSSRSFYLLAALATDFRRRS